MTLLFVLYLKTHHQIQGHLDSLLYYILIWLEILAFFILLHSTTLFWLHPRSFWTIFFCLHWIQFNIASALCFGFLAMRHVGSELPDQESSPDPWAGRWSLNHWATREVPGLFSSFPYFSSPISEHFISQILVFFPLGQSSPWVSKNQLLFQFSSVCDLRAMFSDFWTTITPFFNPQNTARGLKGKKAKDKEAAFARFQNQSQDIKEQTLPKLCNSNLFDLNSYSMLTNSLLYWFSLQTY